MRLIPKDVDVAHKSGAASCLLGSYAWLSSSSPDLTQFRTEEKVVLQATDVDAGLTTHLTPFSTGKVDRVDVTSKRLLDLFNGYLPPITRSESSCMTLTASTCGKYVTRIIDVSEDYGLKRAEREWTLPSTLTGPLLLSWGTSIVTEADGKAQVTFLQDHGGSDLVEFTNRYLNGDTPKLDVTLDILESLCNGLVKLRELGIVHEDIKPENVTCMEGDYMCFRLIDYDTSRRIRESNEAPGGTLAFAAPEKLCSPQFSCYASDIWSVALTAAVTLDTRLEAPIEDAVRNGNVDDVPEIVCSHLDSRLEEQRLAGQGVVVDQIIKMIADMLHLDPRCRPEPAKVIQQCQEVRWNFQRPEEAAPFYCDVWDGFLPCNILDYEQIKQELDQATAVDEAAVDKAAVDKAAVDKAAVDKAAAEKAAADKAAADEAASQKPDHKKHRSFFKIPRVRLCNVS
ncbi:MAG: hypothetical protein KVP17_003253 [Porospora cf. gigantea B]|uniref:uncharacterized protein n=1 Tax=Porospora cf. gigantea B TaxID=2853592 RepID=UPI003571ED7B|nr:MAG: hypothetical protein KVP17_003253 [Porospora cf. gigantea B]